MNSIEHRHKAVAKGDRCVTPGDCFPSIRVLRNYRTMTEEEYEKMKSVSMPAKNGLVLTVSKKLGFVLCTKSDKVIINFTLEEVAQKINETAGPLGPGSAIFLLDYFIMQIINDMLSAKYAPKEDLMKRLTKESDEKTSCLICLEKCTEKSYKTKCLCAYGCHEECMGTWLEKNGTCPICRS